ncbi:MAG: hypothetical protein H6707_03360 [Deltaproteobacteria bacterium]|nr:hypothetical protein [Deltaproteobacteria bacterium]
MSDSAKKSPPRLVGARLRLMARLVEAPGTGPLLFRLACKQLGVDVLKELNIACETAPFSHRHLGGTTEPPIDKG